MSLKNIPDVLKFLKNILKAQNQFARQKIARKFCLKIETIEQMKRIIEDSTQNGCNLVGLLQFLQEICKLSLFNT